MKIWVIPTFFPMRPIRNISLFLDTTPHSLPGRLAPPSSAGERRGALKSAESMSEPSAESRRTSLDGAGARPQLRVERDPHGDVVDGHESRDVIGGIDREEAE